MVAFIAAGQESWSTSGDIIWRSKRKIVPMSLFELIMATIICGLLAFLVYSFPVLGQIIIIGLLSLLWLSCAHQVLLTVRRREAARG